MLKRLLILAIIFGCFSFYFKRYKNPPGTVKIYEGFYADETEVSNFSWLEFEYEIKRRYGTFSKEHLAVIPDTTVWLKYPAGDILAQNYYRSIAYRDYPVVGISYEQALMFCKWRTIRVKQFYALGYREELKINYRLPKESEWEFLAINSNNKNSFKKPFTNDSLKRMPIMPEYTYSGSPNLFKIYNLIGNVAELVEEKSVAKGGSFLNSLEESLPGKRQEYKNPEACLGLRCVCDYTISK